MVKTKSGSIEEGGVHTGTEAWNIAQYYTAYAIALPLDELNKLEDTARFGSVKMDEDLVMTDDQFDKRRAEAVKRYAQKFRQIVSDTLFKVKSKDRKIANSILAWLNVLPKYFGPLLKLKSDSINHNDKIEVNEPYLNYLMNKLVEKKQEYLKVLDHAGLIFRESDEVDLDKMTNEFVNGG